MRASGGAFGDFPDLPSRVVIGYEDLACGLRAMEVYRRSVEAVVGGCEAKIWKFEPLGIPDVFAEASRDIVEADVVIVSIAGDRPLPFEAVQWLDWCGKERTNPDGALLFVIDPAHELEAAASLACEFLQRIAKRANLQFFAPPACVHEVQSPGDVAGFHNSIVGEAVLHSSRHECWGLNE